MKVAHVLGMVAMGVVLSFLAITDHTGRYGCVPSRSKHLDIKPVLTVRAQIREMYVAPEPARLFDVPECNVYTHAYVCVFLSFVCDQQRLPLLTLCTCQRLHQIFMSSRRLCGQRQIVSGTGQFRGVTSLLQPTLECCWLNTESLSACLSACLPACLSFCFLCFGRLATTV